MSQQAEHRSLYLLVGLAVFVNCTGLFIPLIDPDAGVYASISKTMLLENDYVNLWFQETDWLDKPHFPFWVTAVFFKFFGLHDWVYKLPGILFVFIGAWYTYLFAKKYYNKTIGLWATFILLTAMHIIISNNDVRAEPFLTGMIIASIYHFSNALEKKIGWQLVFACFFAALAVMTKGIFTLIPIGGAIAGHLLITKNWKQLFHWRWIVAGILVAIFITPELYCLWKQFDQHPEKTVLGNNNVSGIKFFLWDSQFGRFFNTGPIKGKGDKLFFLHTLLWAFLPWCIVMYAALFNRLKRINKKGSEIEWFTISGSLLTLLLFSLSSFQLPHYSNIIFPLLAIITASFISEQVQFGKKIFAIIQNILTVVLIILMIGIIVLYRPGDLLLFVVSAVLLAIAFYIIVFRLSVPRSYLPYVRSGLAILLVALFLNLSFYPSLLPYQSGNKAAWYLNKAQPGEPVGRIGIYFPSGEFYLNEPTFRTDIAAIASGSFAKARILFITGEEKKQLEENNVQFNIVQQFDEFHVSMLTLKFINAKTRQSELKKHYLVRLLK
jgi:4-amino-4-deoxy-L-arabinose transferase-like glycosyltransferase